VQLAAYAMAHNYVYDTKIQSGIILMCTKDKLFQKFEIKDKEFQRFLWQWLRRVDLYYEKLNELANNHG
jgi:genome maintenance exonuclease 1